MQDLVGKTLGHYRIAEKIGEGGMGEVYRARDPRLGRDVALKVISTELTQRPERVTRFENEARAIAALNHPNILSVFDVGRDKGIPFMVTEVLDGETLRSTMARGTLSDRKTLEVAAQVADGLAAAHAKNIIHRDLKPENIFLTRDGQVKILDFGLAKLIERDPEDPVSTESPTEAVTDKGAAVGTPGYMSPEQLRGQPADARTDIFAFGIILYEMICGRRPFAGKSAAEISASIIRDDPAPLSCADRAVSPTLDRVIRQCLEKNPKDRFESARDLCLVLQAVATPETHPSVARWRSNATLILRRNVTLLVAVSIGAVVVWFALSRRSVPSSNIPATYRQVTFSGEVKAAALSPDGQWVAYVEETLENEHRVLVQDLGGGSPLKVLDLVLHVGQLQWSPTGRLLLCSGYRHIDQQQPGDRQRQMRTFIIPRVGGSVRTLSRLPYADCLPRADWSPDGTRIAGTWLNGEIPIRVIDLATSEMAASFALTDTSHFHRTIDWSPADRILMLSTLADHTRSFLWTVQPDGSQAQVVFAEDRIIADACWSPTGNAIYFLIHRKGDRRDLMSVAINPKTGAVRSAPQVVIAGFDGSGLSLAADGKRLLHLRGEGSTDLWLLEQDETAGDVRQTQLTRGRQRYRNPSLSPDGATVAFSRVGGSGTRQVFVAPTVGGAEKQVTFLDHPADQPVWSPDGSEIAFRSHNDGAERVWVVDSSGGSPRVFGSTVVSEEMAWAPGRKILYQRPGNKNFHLLDPETGEEGPLIEDESVGWVFSPRISPGGTEVAVYWNRVDGAPDGVWAIAVADDTERLLSTATCRPLGWSADVKWLYARDSAGNLVRIVASGGEPELFVELSFGDGRIDDLTPDGRRMIATVEESFSDAWIVDNFDPGAR